MKSFNRLVKLLPFAALLILFTSSAKALTVGYGLPYSGALGVQFGYIDRGNLYTISTGSTLDGGYGYGIGWGRFLDKERTNQLDFSVGRFRNTDIFGDVNPNRYIAMNYTYNIRVSQNKLYPNWGIGVSLGYFSGETVPTANVSFTF